MAKEEVDENESGEDEESEEEEERPKPKQKQKKRGPRNNFTTRAHGSRGDPSPYPKGTPVDARGVPLEDVEIDRATVDRIGGYDAESARLNEQSARVVARKARGEAGIKWNSDAHTRYCEVKRFHPRARIALWQEYPVVDEKFSPVSFSICHTYDDLKQHVREKYWKGNHAIYAWRVYDDQYSNLAVGRFEFAEDVDWEVGGQHEPVQSHQLQQPQQPQNPFGQFGMPGVMMPGVGGMPPIFMPQQSQPQQQTHQQNPVAAPAGDPMAVIGPLLNYLLPMFQNQAAQSAYLQNLPQVIEQKVKEAAPPPAPPAPPTPPPTPIEQMEQAANILTSVNRAGKQMATALGFQQNPNQVNEPPPPGEDDDFPWQIRKVGPFNVAAQDGKVVDSLLVQGAANAGPVIGIVDAFFKKLSDSKKEAAEIELKTLEAKERWERQRLENLERAATLQREMQSPQRQSDPEPWQPPSWAVERKPPPEPEPTS